ncbi:unnamed protein product [Paramecium octaurelia]|uniref:Uncharacterized protein n=1 Tax=Paramecium octaurelia TaxID=43137 RepID=A0A8S1X446_PAROT|nr:unnamed protein product [Paramecium octaurelia]
MLTVNNDWLMELEVLKEQAEALLHQLQSNSDSILMSRR